MSTGIDFRFAIMSKSGSKTKAVKLEPGDHQTLVHQDSSGNWVLNEIPDYTTELLKCQRYMFVPSYNAGPSGVMGYGTAIGGVLQVNVPEPVPLRIKPSAIMSGSWNLRGGGAFLNFIANDCTIAVNQYSQAYISVDISGITGLKDNTIYQLTRNNNRDAMIILDANL